MSCCSYTTPETFPTPPESPNATKNKEDSSDGPDFESFKDAEERLSVNDLCNVTEDDKAMFPGTADFSEAICQIPFKSGYGTFYNN